MPPPSPQPQRGPDSAPSHLAVVVPTHDTRALVTRCLESLTSQTRPPDEIVVVDDGSRDGTAEHLARWFPDAVLIRHERALGFSAAASSGLNRARSDWLLLLNSDTELPPESLRALDRSLAERSRLGIGGAELVYPDGRLQWSGGREPTLLWFFGLASDLPARLATLPGRRRLRRPSGHRPGEVDWVTGAAMVIRRQAWEEVGPFRSEYRFYGQDLDLCTSAREAGWQVAVLEGFRVVHHHGSTIGQIRPEGTDRGTHLALLWSDLLRWAERHRGPSWSRRARWLLRLGGGLRRLLLATGGAATAAERAAVRAALAEI